MVPAVIWCALVFAAAVTRASSTAAGKAARLSKSINDVVHHHLKKLGANEIKTLLRDLDQQTTAAENADEIGADLLNGRLVKELAIKEEIGQEENEILTDIDSHATSARYPPHVLKDDSGTPGKTTAKESGVSYLTSRPVWIESRQHQTHSGSEKDHRFMFYPITPDNENGRSL